MNSSGEPDINLSVLHAFGYGYKLSGYQRQEYLEVGQKLLARGVKNAYVAKRKHFNQNYRSSGHYLAYIYEALQHRTDAVETKGSKALPMQNVGSETTQSMFSDEHEVLMNRGAKFKVLETDGLNITVQLL